jgi:hypothetical protein
MVQCAPAVVTREIIACYLEESQCTVGAEVALSRLVRLGWLRRTHFNGAYEFLPPGVESLADPYIDLRGWRLTKPSARFFLAGSSAAWHLGYLDRRPDHPAIWLEDNVSFPKALRGRVSRVTTLFPKGISSQALAPSIKLLRKRGLDLLNWAEGLPGFGPEALLVQIASRPVSFDAWVDFAGRLADFCADIELSRLAPLLEVATGATRQRAVYLMRLSGKRGVLSLLPKTLQATKIGTSGPAHWDSRTGVSDHVVAPLLNANKKA